MNNNRARTLLIALGLLIVGSTFQITAMAQASGNNSERQVVVTNTTANPVPVTGPATVQIFGERFGWFSGGRTVQEIDVSGYAKIRACLSSQGSGGTSLIIRSKVVAPVPPGWQGGPYDFVTLDRIDHGPNTSAGDTETCREYDLPGRELYVDLRGGSATTSSIGTAVIWGR